MAGEAVMVVVAAACGLVIGLVIGGLGGGGGVLTVPALVYLLGFTPQDATTSSVVVVGVSAALGVAVRIRGCGPDWRTGLAMGAVGVPAAFAGSLANRHVERPTLLVAFAAVTVLAAGAMLISGDPADPDHPDDPDGPDDPDDPEHPGPRPSDERHARRIGSDERAARPAATRTREAPARRGGRHGGRHGSRLVTAGTVVVSGVAVGFLTGFLGVGGGFLVLPVLVVALRTPVDRAIGTSLLVVLVNSTAALVSRAGEVTLDWPVLVPFTLASLAGTVLGHRVAGRLSGAVLTRTFAVLLLVVGVVVGVDALRTA